MPKVFKRENSWLEYKCHNCGYHGIPVKIGQKEEKYWEWDGKTEEPTIKPSVKHFYPESSYKENPALPKYICHYVITNGIINYCDDCTHKFTGKSLPMIEYSEEELVIRKQN